jgi:hypothetical protein
VFLDMESAGGHGISDALGLAGATNLDVVRNPSLSQAPCVARLIIREIIPLTSKRVESDRDQLNLATSLPARRIELRAGKFGIVDFIDLNTWGSDSHLQFLNWTVDNNGAYDYAANTRGYTDAAIIEYDDHWFSVRFLEALMPKVANGIHLDTDFARREYRIRSAREADCKSRGDRTSARLLEYGRHGELSRGDREF